MTVDLAAATASTSTGDVKNPRVLESSGLRDARAVVLAVGGDSTALLAALAIRDHAPDVPVLARVDHAETVERMRRAGADYALSLAQVAAQLLAARLLGHEAILIHPALKVQKVGSSSLIGRHPAELGIRERTGVSVVAIERGDEVIVALDPAFTFEDGDAVYVCGDDGGIESSSPPSRPGPRPRRRGRWRPAKARRVSGIADRPTRLPRRRPASDNFVNPPGGSPMKTDGMNRTNSKGQAIEPPPMARLRSQRRARRGQHPQGQGAPLRHASARDRLAARPHRRAHGARDRGAARGAPQPAGLARSVHQARDPGRDRSATRGEGRAREGGPRVSPPTSPRPTAT